METRRSFVPDEITSRVKPTLGITAGLGAVALGFRLVSFLQEDPAVNANITNCVLPKPNGENPITRQITDLSDIITQPTNYNRVTTTGTLHLSPPYAHALEANDYILNLEDEVGRVITTQWTNRDAVEYVPCDLYNTVEVVVSGNVDNMGENPVLYTGDIKRVSEPSTK